MDQRQLQLILKLQNEASAELRKLVGDLDNVSKATGGLKDQLKTYESQLKKVAIGGTIAFAAISGGTIKAVNDFARFEEQIQKAGANINATADQLETFRDVAKQVGLDTKFSATEAAEALYYLAGGTIDAEEAMAGLQEAVKMAATGELDLNSAVLAAGDAITSYGIAAEDASKISDIFIYSTTRVQQTATELADAYKQVNSTARQAGLSIEETTGILNLFADSGKRGMEGGIALANILKNLTTDVVAEFTEEIVDNTDKQESLRKKIKDTENALERYESRLSSASDKTLPTLKIQIRQTQEKLQGLRSELDATPASFKKMGSEMSDKAALLKKLGVEIFDSSGKIRDMTEVLIDLAGKFEGMTDQQRLANAETIFGARAARDWLTIVGQGSDTLKEYITDLDGATGAADDFVARINEARSPMDVLKATMENFSLTLGQAMMPVLKDVVTTIQPIILGIANWIEKNPELTRTIILVAGAVAGFLAVFGSLGLMIGGITTLFTFLLSPIGLVMLALAALVAIAVVLIANWDKVKAFFARLWEDIKNIFKDAIDWIMSKTLDPFLEMINKIVAAVERIGQGLGNAVSAVGNIAGNIFGGKKSGRATGGPVLEGTPYMVGERGPEMFVPGQSGRIIPAHGLSGGAGSGVIVNVYGDVSGRELIKHVTDAISNDIKRRVRLT